MFFEHFNSDNPVTVTFIVVHSATVLTVIVLSVPDNFPQIIRIQAYVIQNVQQVAYFPFCTGIKLLLCHFFFTFVILLCFYYI